MSAELLLGLTLRRGRSDDIGDVTQLIVAEESSLRGRSEWGTTDTEDWWRTLEDLGEAWVVEAADGGVVAMVGLVHRNERYDCWLAVSPEHKGSELDEQLVAHAEQRAKALGGSVLQFGSLAEDTVLQELLERSGYSAVRHFFRMRIDFAEPPTEPIWPDGIMCTTFDREDARAFHGAVSESFAENWDFLPMEFEAWKRLRLGAPDFDPTLWFVARERQTIAGIIRCDAERWGGGWVALLGVRKAWRRQGIGLALLLQAFGEFFRRGQRTVGLGVDAQNPTGATRLYERAGMRVESEDIVYGKDLA